MTKLAVIQLLYHAPDYDKIILNQYISLQNVEASH